MIPNLLEGGEAVDGEGVGLDGSAVEQDLADVEAGGGDLGGEDELRRGGDHVHVVARGDQVPDNLERAGGVAEAVAGDVVGEDEVLRRRRGQRLVGVASPNPHPPPLPTPLIERASLCSTNCSAVRT
jgi:hypothetical protein